MTALVLLLGGPPGAGKTAVARAWASARPLPTAHVSLDAIRQQVRSGYHSPAESGWGDEARRQYDLAQDIAVASVRRYSDEGFGCVVDDVMFPGVKRARYEGWEAKLQGIHHSLVILMPSLDVCRVRNAGRQGAKRLPDELVDRFYADCVAWKQRDASIIDNSELSAEQAARQIDRLLC